MGPPAVGEVHVPRVRDKADLRVGLAPVAGLASPTAEPEPRSVVSRCTRDGEDRDRGAAVLEVEREVEVGAAYVIEVRETGQPSRQLGGLHRPDRPTTQ